MELREWKLVRSEITGNVHASGYVHNSSEHGEGDRILTSPVIALEREGDVIVIRTKNSVYRCAIEENRTEDPSVFRDFGVDLT